jgi:transmembrane sensor
MTSDEFNALIDRYLAGRASPEETQLIDQFFNSQERRQTLPHYKLSDEMWSAIEPSIRRKHVPAADVRANDWTVKRSSVRRILMPVLVCLMVVMIGYLHSVLSSDPSVHWVTSETTPGQKSLITLADGSLVFLNSATSITYPATFDAGKREIRLTGEAFFQIARDVERPFVVRTGNVITTVLGTSFNIEAFEGQPKIVSVATGKVQVELKENSADTSLKPLVLKPNEEAIYRPGAGINMRSTNPERFLAWKTQTLYFENNTLAEVASKLERWYNSTVEFENESITKCRINGRYKEMDLQSVLESIQYMYEIDYKFINQNHVVLYGKGCDE